MQKVHIFTMKLNLVSLYPNILFLFDYEHYTSHLIDQDRYSNMKENNYIQINSITGTIFQKGLRHNFRPIAILNLNNTFKVLPKIFLGTLFKCSLSFLLLASIILTTLLKCTP